MNRLQFINSLVPSDLTPSQRQEVVRALGPARREARVQAALEAAGNWLMERFNFDERPKGLARLLCALECMGLYGGSPYKPGTGTTRHPAFRGLGRGRRQAADGAAWTASIQEAAGGLVELDHNEGSVIVVFKGLDDTQASVLLEGLVEPASYRVLLWHYCRRRDPDPEVIRALARLL